MALSQDEFETMVDEHGPTLYRIAYRLVGDGHEAEDLVQDAFRSAWLSRERFDAARGTRAWLVSILRRRAVDRWRRHPQPRPAADDAASQVAVEGDDPIAREYSDEMQWALAQLPDMLRETLLLVAVGELTHQEVAELLEVPLGTVLSRVSRARGRLRELLLSAASRQ